jgi:hypothetical protein
VSGRKSARGGAALMKKSLLSFFLFSILNGCADVDINK